VRGFGGCGDESRGNGRATGRMADGARDASASLPFSVFPRGPHLPGGTIFGPGAHEPVPLGPRLRVLCGSAVILGPEVRPTIRRALRYCFVYPWSISRAVQWVGRRVEQLRDGSHWWRGEGEALQSFAGMSTAEPLQKAPRGTCSICRNEAPFEYQVQDFVPAVAGGREESTSQEDGSGGHRCMVARLRRKRTKARCRVAPRGLVACIGSVRC